MDAKLRAKLHGIYSANFNDGEPVGERYGSKDIVNVSQVIDFIDDHLVEFIQQEIAKARIDELEKVAAVSRENVDRLPDEPDYPKNLAVKSAVDEYNKKSSEYIDAYFWFDMAFQPIHTYKRSRIAELSQTLKELKEELEKL